MIQMHPITFTGQWFQFTIVNLQQFKYWLITYVFSQISHKSQEEKLFQLLLTHARFLFTTLFFVI